MLVERGLERFVDNDFLGAGGESFGWCDDDRIVGQVDDAVGVEFADVDFDLCHLVLLSLVLCIGKTHIGERCVGVVVFVGFSLLEGVCVVVWCVC